MDKSFFIIFLLTENEIPNFSRFAGLIRNDISFFGGLGKEAICPGKSPLSPPVAQNFLSFRALARNLFNSIFKFIIDSRYT